MVCAQSLQLRPKFDALQKPLSGLEAPLSGSDRFLWRLMDGPFAPEETFGTSKTMWTYKRYRDAVTYTESWDLQWIWCRAVGQFIIKCVNWIRGSNLSNFVCLLYLSPSIIVRLWPREDMVHWYRVILYLFSLNYNIYNTYFILFKLFLCPWMPLGICLGKISSEQPYGRVHPFDARMRKAELPAAMSWEEFRSLGPWVGGRFFFAQQNWGETRGGLQSQNIVDVYLFGRSQGLFFWGVQHIFEL